MPVKTSTAFDLETFRRGYAEWDVDALFEHCAAAGVRATVENAVVGADRAAATVTCEFPGGRKVVANGIFELEDGRMVRERQVLSGDPK